MKRSELTFADGFTSNRAQEAKLNGSKMKAFDWDKAAKIIKDYLLKYPNLTAEAGLQSDWSCTGGIIFQDGKPVSDSYTYLASLWATPTLVLECDGEEILEVDCGIDQEASRFNSGSKWDNESLKILNL